MSIFTRIKNLENNVAALMSRDMNARIDAAKLDAKAANATANGYKEDIKSAERAALDNQLALGEFLTDVLPELLGGDEND